MTKHISIHDHENNRAIIAAVPQWIVDSLGTEHADELGDVIMDALGLSSGNSEWMLLEEGATVWTDLPLDSFVQDFDANVREAIKNIKE